MNTVSSRPSSHLLLPAVLGLITLLLINLPVNLYLSNALEFSTPLISLLPLWLLAGAVTALVLLLAGWVMPMHVRAVYAAVLAALCLSGWLCANLLVIDYGLLDGSSFDLWADPRRQWLYLLVYLCAVVGAYLLARRTPSNVRIGLWALVTLLAATSVLAINKAGAISPRDPVSPKQARLNAPISTEDLTRFSSRENLLVIMMDTFQSDFLHSLLAEGRLDPAVLDGFRFYPDTLGVAPTTYLTMPAFHSGLSYSPGQAISDYYVQGVEQGSFFNRLGDAGYQIDMVNPIAGRCPEASSICVYQEAFLNDPEANRLSEATHLLDLALFRGLPPVIRNAVYDGDSGVLTGMFDAINLSGLNKRIYDANRVLDLFASAAHVDDGAPTARLIHLLNTHPPMMLDERCRFVGIKRNPARDDTLDQVACGMNRFAAVLEQLKTIGAFDQTLIILVADTGASSARAADDLVSLYARQSGETVTSRSRLIGAANPVLAIKYPNSRHALMRDERQVQLVDIPATVCDVLGVCSMDGVSLLDAAVDEDRTRVFNYYQWRNSYWGLKTIPGLIQYRINGALWKSDSWTRDVRTGQDEPAVHAVRFSDSEPSHWFGLGWGHVETREDGLSKRWATDRSAELFLPLPQGEDLTLRFTTYHGQEQLDGQTMRVTINGHDAGVRAIDKGLVTTEYQVPSDWIAGPRSDVVLDFSLLKRPDSGVGRMLALSFLDLEIIVTDP